MSLVAALAELRKHYWLVLVHRDEGGFETRRYDTLPTQYTPGAYAGYLSEMKVAQ